MFMKELPLPLLPSLPLRPKVSILLVLVRLLYQTFFDYMAEWQTLLIFSSLASMILGSFAGLSQGRIKRLLAYSSIGHVGYLLVAVCCGSLEGVASRHCLFSDIHDYDNHHLCCYFITTASNLCLTALNESSILPTLLCWVKLILCWLPP